MTNTTNKNITFQGNALEVSGKELKVGDTLPSFKLTANDMSDFSSDTLKGKVVVVVTVPSLDTPTCAIETKRFNTEAGKLGDNVKIVVISRDLPFAQSRWCGAEGVTNVTTLSDYKYRTAGEKFGVMIDNWQLLARGIFVADKSGKITHVEYVPSINDEPDYAAVLSAVKSHI